LGVEQQIRIADVRKQVWAILGAGAVAIAFAAAAALYYGARDDAPPVTGSMQNFTVVDRPMPALDVAMLAADGGTQTLDRYRGMLVVMNFWATWCGPCVRELPSLQRLSAALPADRARVVLLSQDRGGFDQVTPFLARLNIDIVDSYVDDKLGMSRAAGVRSLPTTILIGADGTELGRLTGPAEWDSAAALALIDHYLQRR
jgi:thiol-disulfide isomerase/thioredoxin